MPRIRFLLLGVALSAIAACTKTDPLYCDSSADCADNEGAPFCDVDGEYAESDHIKHTCIATPTGEGDDAEEPGDDAGSGDEPDASDDGGDDDASVGDDTPEPVCDAG